MDRTIQALMVYYQHWGMDEIKSRRQQEGIVSLLDKIHDVFFDDGERHSLSELVQEVALLNSWIYYSPNVWNNLLDHLLHQLGGYPFHKPLELSREFKLSQKVNLRVWEVYNMCLRDEDLLSVDAIVAWL